MLQQAAWFLNRETPDGSILCCRGGSNCPAFSPAYGNLRKLPCAGRCHPLRRSGFMVTRGLFGSEATAKESWCRRRESNPHGLAPSGFSCLYGFRRLPSGRSLHGSLWSGLSLHRAPENSEVRCCPSSLYTFLNCPFRLGSGLPFQASPTLSSSASPVSRRALNSGLSPPRLPFRHAGTPFK